MIVCERTLHNKDVCFSPAQKLPLSLGATMVTSLSLIDTGAEPSCFCANFLYNDDFTGDLPRQALDSLAEEKVETRSVSTGTR
jgi:hypothetical protein